MLGVETLEFCIEHFDHHAGLTPPLLSLVPPCRSRPFQDQLLMVFLEQN